MGLEPGTTEGPGPQVPGELEQGRQRHPRSLAGLSPEARHRLADSARRAARPRFALHLRAAVGQRRVRHVPDRSSKAAKCRGRCWSKTCRKDKHQDLDFIIGQLDWEKNVDTHFKEHNYLEPIVDEAKSGDGYTDRWIVYGTVDGEQLFSAKELTLEPGAKCTLQDPGASGWITVQGRGRIGKLDLQTPAMIRFGEDTEDEVFITHEAATAAWRSKTPAASRSSACATSAPTCTAICRRQEAKQVAGGSGRWQRRKNFESIMIGKSRSNPATRNPQPATRNPQPVSALLRSAERSTTLPARFLQRLKLYVHRQRNLHPNNFPKLHNAAWPGVVGKGGEDSEPPIGLDTMLDLTAAAEVDGRKFDGVDLFLFDPHVSIDATDEELENLAERVRSRGLVIGRVVAPVWPPTGGGSAMGGPEEVELFLTQVRKACHIGKKLRELAIRPYGVVRIDSALPAWRLGQGSETNQSRIADTFKAAAISPKSTASGSPPKAKSAGAACTVAHMVELLEAVDRPEPLGFQADMAHTLLYLLGYNAPEDALLPEDFDWSDTAKKQDALKKLTDALRPWTIDFHVAQNDGTVYGSGSHDKTGRHCLPNAPDGKLDIVEDAGYWLRDEHGDVLKTIRHICWDGCMFPNTVMHKNETWNNILAAMVAVRDAHGWQE